MLPALVCAGTLRVALRLFPSHNGRCHRMTFPPSSRRCPHGHPGYRNRRIPRRKRKTIFIRRRDRRVLQFRNADRISNQYLRLRSGRISVFGFYQGGPASEYNLFDYIRFLDTFDLGILKTGIE